jgi:hypothetical protein
MVVAGGAGVAVVVGAAVVSEAAVAATALATAAASVHELSMVEQWTNRKVVQFGQISFHLRLSPDVQVR